MRYPTLGVDRIERLLPQLLLGQIGDVQAAVRWTGTGSEIDLVAIEDCNTAMRSQWEPFRADHRVAAKDAFEGIASGTLHAGLCHLPLVVVDDPGFWRYLTATTFWWYVHWREESALLEGDWTKARAYMDGLRPAECTMLRMFIRGQLALADGSYELASAVPMAADLWRSHIVRVRTSYAPSVTRGLVREQASERMNTDDLRSFAKRVNRVASNVMLPTYDDADASALLSKIRTEAKRRSE